MRDRHVLAAIRQVPREAFVAPGFEEFAYEDTPLGIGEGQTISQPCGPPAATWMARHRESYERLCHDAGVRHFLLDLHGDQALRSRLLEARLERFIGVIYRPETELASHYAAASLPQQLDAWVWFGETSAVVPLGPEHATSGVPETWPFGL